MSFWALVQPQSLEQSGRTAEHTSPVSNSFVLQWGCYGNWRASEVQVVLFQSSDCANFFQAATFGQSSVDLLSLKDARDRKMESTRSSQRFQDEILHLSCLQTQRKASLRTSRRCRRPTLTLLSDRYRAATKAARRTRFICCQHKYVWLERFDSTGVV